MRTVRLLIRGRIQGVGFRAFARRLAAERDITGFVRNAGEECVELVAQGAKLDAFVAAVKEGPRFSQVEGVEEEACEEEPYDAFSVRH